MKDNPHAEGGFDLAPPISGDWHNLSGDLSDILVQRMREYAVIDQNERVTAVRVTPALFRPGTVLCDLQTEGRKGPPVLRSALYGPAGALPLNGSSHLIHRANAKQGIDLSDVTRQSQYLRFFCMFVRGSNGPFEIVEQAAQVQGPDNLDTLVQPPARVGDKDGATLAIWQATVLYGNTLFRATFDLAAGGRVEMEDDTPLCGDVTRRPDLTFDGTGRFRRGGKGGGDA